MVGGSAAAGRMPSPYMSRHTGLFKSLSFQMKRVAGQAMVLADSIHRNIAEDSRYGSPQYSIAPILQHTPLFQHSTAPSLDLREPVNPGRNSEVQRRRSNDAAYYGLACLRRRGQVVRAFVDKNDTTAVASMNRVRPPNNDCDA